MKRLVFLFAALAIGLIVASCATLSKEQCQAGDWRAIGFNDGSEGRTADYVSNHDEACAEFGVAVNRALYTDGRTDGLRSYCRLANAESVGRQGRAYNGVCQGELGVAFARIHRAAADVASAEARINSLDSDINRNISQLAQPDLTEEQRAVLTRELQRMQSDRRSQQLSLRALEASLASLRSAEQARLASLGIAA